MLHAEVEDGRAEGDLFGGLDGSLGLVHGFDAVGFVGADEIEVGAGVAAPVRIGEEGLVEAGEDARVAEPEGEFADGGAIGVVEVVAGGEDFDCWCAEGGASAGKHIEEAGVEAVREEDL